MGQKQREREFEAMVERQGRFLYRVASVLLSDRQDAEKAVQATLTKLYRTGAWQRRMNDERSYLARAVWYSGLDRAGAGVRAPRAADAPEMDGKGPAQETMNAADRRTLRGLIDSLPEELRQPLLLGAIPEMRAPDVAVILGLPNSTVQTRNFRARITLRRMFIERKATTATGDRR